jgi:NTP pyrophosphatase (non-canonical NTP hydrolase)
METRLELEAKIIDWANDRDLIKKENVLKQMLKTVSEIGELADAIAKGDEAAIIDGIGDAEVCLTLLKEQLNYEMNYPLSCAYNEIKDRTGKTVNGTFIKDVH